MEKSPEAFRTISEVAELLETPAHVLRFWESRFPQIRPVKRAGGRRYYRPSDVALLSGIKRLLHEDGLTIRGVQKILQEQGVKHVAGLMDEEAEESLAAEAAAVPPEPIPLFPARPSEEAPEARQGGLFDSLPEATTPPETPTMDDAAATPGEADGIDEPAEAPAPPVAADGETPEPAPHDMPPKAPALDPSAETPPAPMAETSPVSVTDDTPSDSLVVTDTAQDALADASASAPLDEAPKRDTDEDALTEPDESLHQEAAATPPEAVAEPTVASGPITGDAASTALTAPHADPPLRWLASDLRALRATALHGKADQAEALGRRLRALRERLASSGRPPVR